MLFSDSAIAGYINDQFEPVWQSVRKVPTVQIDFGAGRIVKRTLHGNIATYVCMPDGRTVDILPGIYEPVTYLSRLKKLHRLAEQSLLASGADQPLRAYHRKALGSHQAMPLLLSPQRPGFTNSPKMQLLADTQLNEIKRRKLIHRMLADNGAVKPQEITKWLYREVLHADIDDPYMGLGATLFSNYPFNDGPNG